MALSGPPMPSVVHRHPPCLSSETTGSHETEPPCLLKTIPNTPWWYIDSRNLTLHGIWMYMDFFDHGGVFRPWDWTYFTYDPRSTIPM